MYKFFNISNFVSLMNLKVCKEIFNLLKVLVKKNLFLFLYKHLENTRESYLKYLL